MTEDYLIISKQKRGQVAEAAAAYFLSIRGYRIISRNYRTRYGEIDIIAQDDESLVFIEVRSKHNKAQGLPQETVNYRKQRKIRNLTQSYLAKENCLDCICRFDVVAVIVNMSGAVIAIELIKNAF